MQDGKPPDGEGVSAGAGYDEQVVRLFLDRMMPAYLRENTD